VDVDGTPAGDVEHGDRLAARVRPNAGQVVRLSARDHASRSRVKLSLLDLLLRRDQLVELVPPEPRRQAAVAAGRSAAADERIGAPHQTDGG
jgi:NAD+ kinase